jgi:hypothetical protein
VVHLKSFRKKFNASCARRKPDTVANRQRTRFHPFLTGESRNNSETRIDRDTRKRKNNPIRNSLDLTKTLVGVRGTTSPDTEGFGFLARSENVPWSGSASFVSGTKDRPVQNVRPRQLEFAGSEEFARRSRVLRAKSSRSITRDEVDSFPEPGKPF